ncbi:MAG TPA: L-histidine N(alpha)-methyltransferase [Pseudomonadota bacterium]|nr:L-histidine N(alpha)-methyltransferase [Pseudomonadota bacterium]HNO68187.1 L-histidine N(alpha)-methyltransferase [Pseudomonadota bacterium]
MLGNAQTFLDNEDSLAQSQPEEFPALMEPDPVAESTERAQRGLLEAMTALEDLRDLAPGQKRALRSFLKELGTIYQALGGKSRTPQRHAQLARLLRDRRLALGMSLEALAKRIGVSASTLKQIERGVRPPSRKTLLLLQNAIELELNLDGILAKESSTKPGASLNCYIAPGYEPVKMVMELSEMLNGPGGYLEQTSAYLEHQSALQFLRMANDPAYVSAFRAGNPLDRIAKVISENTRGMGIEMIALGAGDAREEVRLVQDIVARMEIPDLRLYLLDISQPLLSEGFKHAADVLCSQQGVSYFAMQANFHHMERYPQLHYTPERSHRRRLVTLLGRTIGNLDNEPKFFKYNLVGCQEGDLLLMDFQLAYASTSDLAAIRRREPVLSGGRAQGQRAREDWLASAIWRHCRDVTDVKFHYDLLTDCSVPGSYSIEAVATVHARGRDPRRFSLFRFRRYDPDQLASCLSGLGWDLVEDFPRPQPQGGGDCWLLFRRAKQPK